MAQLKKEIKLFIVRSLAIFNTPTETAKAVNDEFQVKVTRQQCEKYDPTKRAGMDLSAELKTEFELTRKEFLDVPKNIPISNVAYRQARRQALLNANAGKNPMLELAILEQGAKEDGGAYTNRKELTGLNGAPIQQESTTTVIATPDQIRETMRKLDETY